MYIATDINALAGCFYWEKGIIIVDPFWEEKEGLWWLWDIIFSLVWKLAQNVISQDVTDLPCDAIGTMNLKYYHWGLELAGSLFTPPSSPETRLQVNDLYMHMDATDLHLFPTPWYPLIDNVYYKWQQVSKLPVS